MAQFASYLNHVSICLVCKVNNPIVFFSVLLTWNIGRYIGKLGCQKWGKIPKVLNKHQVHVNAGFALMPGVQGEVHMC